jgi:hypothetical protein
MTNNCTGFILVGDEFILSVQTRNTLESANGSLYLMDAGHEVSILRMLMASIQFAVLILTIS